MNKNVLPFAAATLGSLALSVSASAQLLDVSIVEVDLGAPSGFVTYQVIATFAGMDVAHAWGTNSGTDVNFWTGNGEFILNDSAGAFFSFKPEDLPSIPFSAAWDSYVTLGTTNFIGNSIDYSPGFAGSNGSDAFLTNTTNAFSQAGKGVGGLVFNGNPDNPITGPSVLLAQFTIAGIAGGVPGDEGHNGIHLEGMLSWGDDGQGGSNETSFAVDNIVPAPGAMALLGLAGLAGARRRRRRG